MMPRESSVFVVQEPPASYNRVTGGYVAKDLSSAQRYGKLIPILAQAQHASLTPGPSLFQMQKSLREFSPEFDYICYAGGDPMALALALLTLRDMGFQEVNVLRWDKERDTDGNRKAGGYYTPVRTPLRP
jgi:hypothetical protein